MTVLFQSTIFQSTLLAVLAYAIVSYLEGGSMYPSSSPSPSPAQRLLTQKKLSSATSKSPLPHPFDTFDPSFATWFAENGGYVDPCLEYRNGGLFAKHCHVESAENLILVPDSLVLSADRTIYLDERVRIARQKIVKELNISIHGVGGEEEGDDNFNFVLSVLSIFLCLNDGNNKNKNNNNNSSTFFQPYVNALPLHFCQTPICVDDRMSNLNKHTVKFERALDAKRRTLLSYLKAR